MKGIPVLFNSVQFLWCGFCLINFVVIGIRTQKNETSNCIKVFEAAKMTDEYDGSCSPIKFPCSQDLLPKPGDCGKYFICAIHIVYECNCSVGTEFDIDSKNCIRPFDANCTCGNGYLPSTLTASTTLPTTSTTQAPLPSQKSSYSVAIALGIIIPLIIIGVIIFIVFFILRKKQQQKLAMRKELPSVANLTYDRHSSLYSSIKENSVPNNDVTHPSRKGTLPPVPQSTTDETLENTTSQTDVSPVYDNRIFA